ncbi:sulfite reductase (NADPH) hemoprotein beta-component [Marinospirillum celere]|uniref:Sulfite reductase (NADPH) hemoprotein beta-component n=1 Tax=Marinospirillum celere TaxID=1122252 RepID=A0A1I1GAR0_9GAMM|nr:nitrite/sulfite reductase [Marinospirillum celere]SFC06230.1 sulfite reductase (NADPH) hemoprotein beta-component [Marinospirillum celere]
MYTYNQVDQQLVDERVAQYRDQTRRYLAGDLPEEEFLALRLMNGLYVQRQAPMLRVAIPYGTFSATQMRAFAHIARTWDKGYGHFTTRTNIQFNWPKLEEVPDILAELAKVQMHAIQTSGNCIRNTTTDPLAGVAADEVEDPRPWCELIRQWSTLHPEFAYLPRKFKIAVSGGPKDRASARVHDIGLELVRNAAGETGFKVLVGGGLGRTPFIGKVIRDYLEPEELFSYLEAILRIYNLKGRRDNKYKARIKILVAALGIDEFRRLVEKEWQHLKGGELRLTQERIDEIKAHFQPFEYAAEAAEDRSLQQALDTSEDFRVWYQQNTQEHKVAGYRVVHLSLKPLLGAPGDITEQQMDVVADLADAFSFGEIRATQDQNLVLTDVQQKDLYALWQRLQDAQLARANINTLTDMIVCPGFDFCNLANARTLNIADEINQAFEDLDYLHDLGDIQLNMSGCINACAHHHIGHIGILGVDKKGEDWYQITLGGSATENAKLGKVLGRAVPADQVPATLRTLLETYLELREEGESFVQAYERVGIEPFKKAVYQPA